MKGNPEFCIANRRNSAFLLQFSSHSFWRTMHWANQMETCQIMKDLDHETQFSSHMTDFWFENPDFELGTQRNHLQKRERSERKSTFHCLEIRMFRFAKQKMKLLLKETNSCSRNRTSQTGSRKMCLGPQTSHIESKFLVLKQKLHCVIPKTRFLTGKSSLLT